MNSQTPLALFFGTHQPYEQVALLQERLVALRLDEALPDLLLVLEHTPVITMGSRSKPENLLGTKTELNDRGITLTTSSRGGDVTYHGPGQLVLYPIIKLSGAGADARGHLANLEETAILTASDFGVEAFRRAGMTGAWTRGGKLAAIGVRFRRWVAFHGMSFNVNPDMSGFALIVPCGLMNEQVTSLAALLGKRAPDTHSVRESMIRHARAVFDRDWHVLPASAADLPQPLREALASTGIAP